MRLPAADLGIMAEHLAAHEGMINKLKIYYLKTSNSVLKSLLSTHIHVLKTHVQAMLSFIDPNQVGPFHLPNLENIHLNITNENFTEMDKDITLEARATAKLMSSDNFMSALMMKDSNVKHVHIEMALQEVKIQDLYSVILKRINGDFTPKATIKMQILTLQKYYHILTE
jgi:hypothetical protein